MSSAYWTLDLGNSRLKLTERRALADLRSERDARPTEGELTVLPNDAQLVAQLRVRLESIELAGVAFSSVADQARTSELEALLRSRTPTFVNSSAALISNETRTPETVGSDRLFAALGALCVLPEDESCALVCDAGTALTVDLVQRVVGAGSVRARFLGGAIAPGPELLASALARGGARLLAVDYKQASPSSVPALGRDTEAALLSGIVHGFRGAARELVSRLSASTEGSSAVLYLTGGARSLLAGAFGERPVLDEPALVDLGLCAALAIELEAC